MDQHIIDKCLNLKDAHSLRFGLTNERPWGSAELIVVREGQNIYLNTGMVFGWGFTSEDMLGSFLQKVANGEVDSAIVEYLGETIVNEVKEIFSQPAEPVEAEVIGEISENT